MEEYSIIGMAVEAGYTVAGHDGDELDKQKLLKVIMVESLSEAE